MEASSDNELSHDPVCSNGNDGGWTYLLQTAQTTQQPCGNYVDVSRGEISVEECRHKKRTIGNQLELSFLLL